MKIFLSVGTGLSSRGAILENRTIAPYVTQPTDAFYWDIHGMIGYLEFPVLAQYKIFISKKIKIMPILGLVFSFPVKDLSHFEKKQFFKVKVPGQGLSEYDYWFEQESGFGDNLNIKNVSKIVVLNFGIQIQYSRYIFDIRYIMDNRNTYHLDSLSDVSYKMHSVYFLISFIL
jgi:hypothetical protein